jgi:Flp pilus assembly protein TadD
VLLMVVMLLGFGFALWWVQKRAEAVTEARTDLEEAQRLRTVEKWSEALSAVRRAQAVLRDFGSDVHLRHQVEQLGKDLEMARRLEEARLQGAVVKDGHFDVDSCIAAFVEAFAWYGLDVEHGDADATAEFIRSRAISPQLVAALDFWASLLNPLKQSQKRSHLLAVARAADPDEWRNRWRDAWERQDGTAMNDLLASADSEKLLPTTLCLLGISVDKHEKVASERAAILLRRAQQQHPADFWINHDLALLLHDSQPRRPEEVIGFFRVAVALRPESPGVHNNLGVVLDENRQSDEAITEYRQAIRLKEDYAEAYYNLGIAWKTKGQLDEAIEEFREATRLKKDYAEAHNSLANALRHKGRPDEAIIEYHEVCRIRKNLPEAYKAYYNLGTLLHEKGQLDEAIEEFREATRLKEDYAEAHNNLGTALATKGQLDEAIDEFRTAIRVEKNFPEAYKAHNNLGNALRAKRQLDEAIAEYNTAIRLKKDFAEAHNNLGAALQKKGRLDEAIAEFREAIRLKKAFVEAHTNLGTALATKGQLDDAIAEFRETTRLERENPVAHFNLGIALATKGHLDEAIAEYREAIRLKKDYAAAHNNLGTALATKGQLDDAIAEFRTAIRLKKDFAEAHNNLGAALQEKGRLDEAIAEFREAIHVKKDYAQAHNNLKEALALRETLSKLGAILSGKAKADNAAEQLALASVCQAPYKRLYAAAARFYRDAFAAQPHLADDLDAQHRYKAACAAALAGCGQGKDADKLDAKERARLRQQALDWLRADLKAYRQVMEKAADKAGPAIAQRMQHWLKDDDFAGVREADTLARLPEAERLEWHKLWEEVKALRQRAAQPPKTTSSARP